ncbi:MAG: 4-(cytidine 5'-diphospho)-2-C-methyl-D-erythritol kinase [Lachnospiraceae bacterium]|nr:4-(cytidine 5'-diphospho)-2-C-methyl-D-erythritol kinase [Lachnospiraceae bacterium]
MDGIILKPFAKINLGLDIIGRRENGYHEVKMVMQSIDLKDTMKMSVLDDDVVTMKCNLDYLPTDDNNIVVKAVKLVKREYGINKGVRIELEKNIPVAAGMAGGSSNAAAALHGMSELFDLKLNTEELCKLGVKLGADVPYCIMGGTMLAEGIGEVLTPLKKAPDCYVAIVKPSFAVSTKAVYEAYDKLNDNEIVHPDIDGIIKAINEGDLYKMCALMGNTLESVTEAEYPYIKEIKSILVKNGAIKALMSGSGPTVFGIFDDLATANQAISCIEDSDMIEKKTVVELYK